MPTTLDPDRKDSMAEPGLERIAYCLFCGSRKASVVLRGVSDLFFKADAGTFSYATCGDCGSLWLKTARLASVC